MSFCAVDFETSYDKERDIRTMGSVAYLRHPDTDIYLVSIAFPDGSTWAGAPAEAPWSKIAGLEWVSHNRSFDKAVLEELRYRGMLIPGPSRWHCSADLMAYIQAPRSLAGACETLLRTKVDKTTRDDMKGKDFRSLNAQERRAVLEYARSDALLCWMLWRDYSHLWPEHERWLSEHTTEMGLNGIGLDLEEVRHGTETLKRIAWEAERAIPWSSDHPITSPKQLALACRAADIPPPRTTDAKSEEFDAWADEYADKAPFVAQVQKWRRANRLVKTFEAMQVRHVDGRLRYQLKYFGAQHTGRWSGDSGLNMQNFPKKPFEGVDVRRCLVPSPGNVFLVPDLSQIEARVALWLAGDDAMLARLAAGEDLYEAHARLSMGYRDPRPLAEVNPDMRQLAKVRCLSGDTLVLAKRGYIPITQVRSTDLLWDGVEWVHHDGVVCTGYMRVRNHHGDEFTDDHELFTSDSETTPASACVSRGQASRVARFRSSCQPRDEIRRLGGAVVHVFAGVWEEAKRLCSVCLSRMRNRALGQLAKSANRPVNRVPVLRDEANASPQGFTGVGFVRGIVRASLLGCVEQGLRLRRFLRRIGRTSMSEGDGRVPVFDVLRCGPRSRFCTPWAVAHNCLGLQFGLGPGKFRRIAKAWAGIDITDAEAKRIVYDYREKNKPIVNAWEALERLVLQYRRDDKGRRLPGEIELPSGRIIRYFDLREEGKEDGEGWSSWVGRTVRGDYFRKLYGGLLFENGTQATARDVFAAKIPEVESLGLPVVLHVHDELVMECDEASAEEAKVEVDRVMATAPAWAEGLPIKAETKIMRRYEKR